MNTRDRILFLLEKNRGEYVSGLALAGELGVTRSAVWKAVKALQNNGHAIEAVTNRGYRLSSGSDVLSAQSILLELGEEHPFTVEVVPSLPSTNTCAKDAAAGGAPEGFVIAAAEQTAGRGRFGRQFFSPGGTGVYFSVVLRPDMPSSDAVLITSAAAVAVAETVEHVTGAGAQIKWVNDVFVNRKKICGILTEASIDVESGGLQYAVLGIGINAAPPDGGFPAEISDVAGAALASADGAVGIRPKLIAGTLLRFWRYYERLADRAFLDEYRRRSFILGRRVAVKAGGGERPATALSIDDECHLVVQYDNGETARLSSGEVSVAPDLGGF